LNIFKWGLKSLDALHLAIASSEGLFDTTGVAEAGDSLKCVEEIIQMIDGARRKIIADLENPS